MVGIFAISVIAIASVILLAALFFRVVVSTNDVHIVQSARKTTSYGRGLTAGNSYYRWPAWFPRIGVKVIRLPVSVFNVNLREYAAYDKGRVPFVLDLMAFFRISDAGMAAERVHTFEELQEQLQGILQGAARTILAKSEIEEILEGRSAFGDAFTTEVDHQLEQWGVKAVKNIEFMDIRDAQGHQVIANIMAKKQSIIEMQSRTEVAQNLQKAREAEINAEREVQVRQQEAMQTIGQRTAEKEKQVGIANEQAKQEIREQARITAEKDMAVKKVNEVRTAEITKEVQVVAAQQQRETDIVRAEGEKQQTTLIAEGHLNAKKLEAQGIEAEGAARASAEKALQLAPVTAQIELAKEIGANEGYQKYLIGVRGIEKDQVVGVEQAKALENAEIKIIANTGSPADGVKDVMDLFSAKGGLNLGAAIEAFRGTDVGGAIVDRVIGTKPTNGATRPTR